MRPLIYTTPTCRWCKATKGFFKEHNVEYDEKDVSVDHEAAHEMIEKSGQMGVPVIDFGGKFVIGYDPDTFKEILEIR